MRSDARAPFALGIAVGLLAWLAAGATVAAGSDGTAAAPVTAGEERCADGQVTVLAETGAHRFAVEVARTPQEQARGLMFRPSLATDAGMLFVYPEPSPASFWMKNTMISLDIIFIGDDGRVLNIAERTTPYSLRPLPSDGPVRAVLEIGGGLSEELGIGPGTQVVHPAFRAAAEAHLCEAGG